MPVPTLRGKIATPPKHGGLFARRQSRASRRSLASAPSADTATATNAGDGASSSGIQLHCADAITREFSTEQQGERAKVVMQSSPRMPAVAFFGGKYGDRWYVDIIALTHNAIRRQLFDAFTIANALGKLLLDVSDVDLARVYAWLGTVDAFVQVAFDVEDRFVYPMIDTHIRNAKTSRGEPVLLPELLSVHGRDQSRSQVRELLSAARKTRDVATGETAAKIHALRYALDQFGASILDYFAAMERFAPKLLKKTVKNGATEKLKIERKMFEHIRSQPQGDNLAALLMQCIESRTRRMEFLDRNIKKDKVRAQFRGHVKNVEATHMQLARTFDSVAGKYERRFNVTMFMAHYDASTDASKTLEMFGSMDINYEPNSKDASTKVADFQLDSVQFHDDTDEAVSPTGLGPYPPTNDDDVIEIPDDAPVDAPVDVHEHEAFTNTVVDTVPSGQTFEGMDDDVLEIRATEEDALAMEALRR